MSNLLSHSSRGATKPVIVVLGEVQVEESDLAAFQQCISEVEAATRQEPGCFTYAFGQDAATPTQFWLSETWADQASLNAHGQTSHIAKFRSAIGALKVRRFIVKRYEAGPEFVMVNNQS